MLKTRNSELWKGRERHFERNYVYLHSAAARYLVGKGIKCVGIDYLSIDKYDDAALESHVVLFENNTLIIEGLDLSEVAPGEYQMLCAPLKLPDAEAAPARVLLIKE